MANYLMPFVSVRVMVTNLVPDGHHQGVIATARSLQKLLSLNAGTSASMSPSVGRPSVFCGKSQHKCVTNLSARWASTSVATCTNIMRLDQNSMNTWSVHRGSGQGTKLMKQCETHSNPVTQAHANVYC